MNSLETIPSFLFFLVPNGENFQLTTKASTPIQFSLSPCRVQLL